MPGRIKSLHPVPGRYVLVSLTDASGKMKTKGVHRLVAAAFIGLNDEKQVNHIDGNKHNNSASNLEYCSPAENLRHCIDVLGKKRGESYSPLTADQVRSIRLDDRPNPEVAKQYGIRTSSIWRIKARLSWRHVE
jgi:hypothetical protein